MRSLILRAAHTTFVPVFLGHTLAYWLLMVGVSLCLAPAEDARSSLAINACGIPLAILGLPLVSATRPLFLPDSTLPLVIVANSVLWATCATIGVRVWRRWRGRAVVSAP